MPLSPSSSTSIAIASSGISMSVNLISFILSDINLLKLEPDFNMNVTGLAYKSMSSVNCILGIPFFDTFTLLMHSGSVNQKTFIVPGILYWPMMISIALLKTISFFTDPSANVIPFP